MQYIILDGKTPTHGFKNGKGTKSYDEVKEFDNVAVVVPQGYCVLDFDTSSDAEAVLKIVEALDLKCRVMKTTRGVHCWFRAPEGEVKNFIKQRLAVGIYCDRKAGGRNAYVKIKQDGKMREWLRMIPAEDMEVVPPCLMPVSAPAGKFEFKGMTDGSGRNQELFNYIVYLQTKRYTKDQIIEIIRIINEYVFDDPLSESEIATICRDDAFKPDDVIEKEIAKAEKKVGFSHNEFADQLCEEFHIININHCFYIYDKGYYHPGDILINKRMRELFPGITKHQKSEVFECIRDNHTILMEDIKIDYYIVNLKNTKLDLRTGECIGFSTDEIEFNGLPVTYDPSAYCADIDKMLNMDFGGDHEVINLFEEMLGYTLIRHARYQKAFLFYGSGSNGKSTVLDMIEAFLGPTNYSTIPLDKLTARFMTAELEYKLANIGDDVDNVTLRDTGTLKKIFAGNAIQVERKGEPAFTIKPYATHIFSCNAIPRSFDKSEGFYRRWMIIPFNTVITPDSDDYDPMLIDKVTTDTALSYLLNIAIRGARRLMANGHFTEPQAVKDILEAYKTDNSNVLSWIADKQISMDYLLDKPKDVLYSEFCDWSKVSGIKETTGSKTFYREIISRFGFDEIPIQRKIDGKRYFRIKLD